MRAIKSIDGLIVPERHILGIKKYDGETWVSLIVNEGRDIGTGGRLEPCEIKFNESPDELAAMLGWDIVNEKGTDGVDARLAARFVDLTRERDEALAKLEWLTRWRLQSDVPCPFNGEELIEYRNGDSKGRCYVKDLETSDSWRPLVDQLDFYYAEHNGI